MIAWCSWHGLSMCIPRSLCCSRPCLGHQIDSRPPSWAKLGRSVTRKVRCLQLKFLVWCRSKARGQKLYWCIFMSTTSLTTTTTTTTFARSFQARSQILRWINNFVTRTNKVWFSADIYNICGSLAKILTKFEANKEVKYFFYNLRQPSAAILLWYRFCAA